MNLIVIQSISKKKKLDRKTVRIFHHVQKYEEFYRIILSKEVSAEYYYMLRVLLHAVL